MATPAHSSPRRIEPGPGQESVWDYPRPPRLERCQRRIRVELGGEVVADSRGAWRVLETSHPPVYYVPLEDVRNDLLQRSSGGSYCEWKGRAIYYDVVVGDRCAQRAAWAYPSPTAGFRPMKGCVAFYAAAMDGCWIDDERAQHQPGGFYGGWVTADVVGPFKGDPGSWGW